MTHTLPSPTGAPFIEINTPAGRVLGQGLEGLVSFKGIPYAAPPIGELRFAPPRPALDWQGTLNATAYGPTSLQDQDPLPDALPGTENNFYHHGATASEDCLTLNVWTPDTSGSAPVLVWIHGGAFMYGSGSGSWTDGSTFARTHGVVVVSLNYRLGILGGLYLGWRLPELSNFGLLDQIAGLAWVRENIAAYGGDPDRITVGGQSAGAMATAALLVAPAAKGLFGRAIIESGHLAATSTVSEAEANSRTVVRQLHLDPDAPDLLDSLREVSLYRIAEVQRRNGLAVRTFPLVADGVTLASAPLDAVLTGDAATVDLLIGTNAEEHKLFGITGWAGGSTATLSEDLAAYLSDADDLARAVNVYSALLASEGDDRHQQIATDHDWKEPAHRLATAHATAGNRVFLYEFAWKSQALNGSVGAAHLVELPFVFGNLTAPGVDELLGSAVSDPQVTRLSEQMNEAWAKFVTDGDLEGSPLGAWPPLTSTNDSTMVIDLESESIRSHASARLALWREVKTVPAFSSLTDEVAR